MGTSETCMHRAQSCSQVLFSWSLPSGLVDVIKQRASRCRPTTSAYSAHQLDDSDRAASWILPCPALPEAVHEALHFLLGFWWVKEPLLRHGHCLQSTGLLKDCYMTPAVVSAPMGR